jgi:hypothetical protein
MEYTETILGVALSATLGALVSGLAVVTRYGARLTAIEVKAEMMVSWLSRVETKLDRVLESRKIQ